MIEAFISLSIGTTITLIMFASGFILKSKWLKRLAIFPLVISSMPLLLLFLVFGDCC
jgi:putative effector of murein hydrolase